MISSCIVFANQNTPQTVKEARDMKAIISVCVIGLGLWAVPASKKTWSTKEYAGACFATCMAEEAGDEQLCVHSCLVLHCKSSEPDIYEDADAAYAQKRSRCIGNESMVTCIARIMNEIIDDVCSDC
jgi:hypothetical protein